MEVLIESERKEDEMLSVSDRKLFMLRPEGTGEQVRGREGILQKGGVSGQIGRPSLAEEEVSRFVQVFSRVNRDFPCSHLYFLSFPQNTYVSQTP